MNYYLVMSPSNSTVKSPEIDKSSGKLYPLAPYCMNKIMSIAMKPPFVRKVKELMIANIDIAKVAYQGL